MIFMIFMFLLVSLTLSLNWYFKTKETWEQYHKLTKELTDAISQYCIRWTVEKEGDLLVLRYLPKFRRDVLIDRIVENWYEYRHPDSRVIVLKGGINNESRS
jgi:hypothetical protein